jgi:phosphoenolpyruvate synthase/pyruvate phosphate dikinase
MHFITTLANIDRSQAETLGYRASDLGILKEKGFNIPLSFVVNNEAFEEFMAENGLKVKIARVIEEKEPSQAFPDIIGLFQKSMIPKELGDEIVEAYESLTIEPGTSASSVVSGHELPFVTFIRSPNYLTPTEDNEGILQNIKGKEIVVEALKLIWATAYSPVAIAYRKKSGINDFKLGVIIQKMKKNQASAMGYSSSEFDERLIVVKSFSGLQDYDNEILGKDIHEVHANSLTITKAEVNAQEYRIERHFETEDLVKRQLLSDGARQKLNDKIICEIARLTKKAKSIIGKELKVFFSIQDEYVSILHANRLIYEPKKQTQEYDEIDMKVDESGNKVIEHKHEFTAMQKEEADEKFILPEIISPDEAKEHLMKTSAHKIFSLEGFEDLMKKEGQEKTGQKPAACEPLEKDKISNDEIIIEPPRPSDSIVVPLPPVVEIIKEEKPKDETQEKIIVEENLLEQVLRIKELIERMEEHALNSNKESYEREIRKLKDIISRVRS